MTGERGKTTETRLKQTAEWLFARHGVDGVTVRDIVAAAGLRNVASLNYYFGGKDALVRTLILDGARESEQWRLAQLATLSPETASTRDVLQVLAWPLLSVRPVRFATDTHIRFINHLSNVNRPLFEEVVGDQCNQGYQQCLDLLRARMPPPRAASNQRLILLSVYLRSVFAAREAEIERHPSNNVWNQPGMIETVLDTAEGMLAASSG